MHDRDRLGRAIGPAEAVLLLQLSSGSGSGVLRPAAPLVGPITLAKSSIGTGNVSRAHGSFTIIQHVTLLLRPEGKAGHLLASVASLHAPLSNASSTRLGRRCLADGAVTCKRVHLPGM